MIAAEKTALAVENSQRIAQAFQPMEHLRETLICLKTSEHYKAAYVYVYSNEVGVLEGM